MLDVARRAGVSTATVSRVFAGHAGATSEATAARVRSTATDLGYVVNGIAASLRVQYTSSVGLILADISNPFFGRLASGVENVLSAAGYGVILGNTNNDVEEEKRLLALMARKQVDAIVLASSASSGGHIREAIGPALPVILVDSELPDVAADVVAIDNRAAAGDAVSHLLDLGHREVAIVCGRVAAAFDRERLDGFRHAFEKRRLSPPENLVLRADSTFEGGRAAVAQLLGSGVVPTAIFASNNMMTIGALAAIFEAGLSIPGDISVVGFDDLEWHAVIRPGLSTIAQPAYAIGKSAAEQLLRRLGATDRTAPTRLILDTELVLRASTAAPRRLT